MKRMPLLLPALMLTLLVAIAAGVGCSKDKKTNAVIRELDSGDVVAGGSYDHTFTTAGNYPYHCEHHPTVMKNVSITVDAASSATSIIVHIVGPTSPPGYAPSDLAQTTIKPGGNVHWINDDTITHTVTSD